jgi:hypothetical protein
MPGRIVFVVGNGMLLGCGEVCFELEVVRMFESRVQVVVVVVVVVVVEQYRRCVWANR